MSDPYLDQLEQHWDDISMMFDRFQEEEPIIEFDVATTSIRAMPAEEYLNLLSDRTREEAKAQYRQSVQDGAMMLFVRDEPQQVLRSYIFDL